jgi:WD40 repeat protein
VFSRDGGILASGSLDGTVKLWALDVDVGRELRTLIIGPDPVSDVAFSKDGRTLALASSRWDGTVKLWDVASGHQLQTAVGGMRLVSFSPDGNILAAGSQEGIKLWDVATWRELRTLPGHKYGVFSLAFSPDGRTMAS